MRMLRHYSIFSCDLEGSLLTLNVAFIVNFVTNL